MKLKRSSTEHDFELFILQGIAFIVLLLTAFNMGSVIKTEILYEKKITSITHRCRPLPLTEEEHARSTSAIHPQSTGRLGPAATVSPFLTYSPFSTSGDAPAGTTATKPIWTGTARKTKTGATSSNVCSSESASRGLLVRVHSRGAQARATPVGHKTANTTQQPTATMNARVRRASS